MKTTINFGVFIFIALIFGSCLKDDCEVTTEYTVYEAILKSEEDIRAQTIGFEQQRPLANPGKIYVYKQYIFINEVREGIHVYDNSDPSAPNAIGFIEIDGNIDMAIKNDVLFADAYMDLYAIDIGDIQNPSVLHREHNTFQSQFPYREGDQRVIRYEKTDKSEVIDCNSDYSGESSFFRNSQLFVSETNTWAGAQTIQPSFVSAESFDEGVANLSSSGGTPSNIGVGGSMAGFTIAKDHLYALDKSSLHVMDISSERSPQHLNEISTHWGIETIFPYEDYLYFGAEDGMYIYDLSNPSSPEFISKVTHVRSCDPVVVQDELAYVTLRGGSQCQGFSNQLEIYDVSDVTNPMLLETYSMQNPHGLSIQGAGLLICEGDYGLKSFRVGDQRPPEVQLLKHIEGLHAYDVIQLNSELALVIGKDGFYQYDIRDRENPQLISKIASQQ